MRNARAAPVFCRLLLCGLAAGALDAAAAERAALIAAVKAGDTAQLRRMLASAADPNEADADGTTALHWAVHRADLPGASLLLEAGAAVDAANRYGVRPTYLAAENGDAPMLPA